MWNKNEINTSPNSATLILFQGVGIYTEGHYLSLLKRACGTLSAAGFSVYPEDLIKKYFLELMAKSENVLKQEREILPGSTIIDHLKEFIHLMTAEEHRDHFDDNPNFIQDFFRRIKTKSSLLRIKRKIDTLARKIDAPRKLRPSYGSFDYEMDSYFIEIDKKGVMRLIETEKGQVHEVRRTRDLDELLYWIFTNITFSMAFKLSLEKSIGSMDRRKLIFQFQEELLGKLNLQWKDKIHAEYIEFLKNHPTDDIKGRGLEYYEKLRKQIRAEIVEKSASYFRFPKP
ncbi:MAG TPA: Imm63 family immunity protein [Prolixibacteraceae bacterium]|nr:Imm63 family immunity protein [Prolixibacteraceae bacterium]